MNTEMLQRLTQAIQLLYNASRLAPLTANDHDLCAQAAREALEIAESLKAEEEANNGKESA